MAALSLGQRWLRRRHTASPSPGLLLQVPLPRRQSHLLLGRQQQPPLSQIASVTQSIFFPGMTSHWLDGKVCGASRCHSASLCKCLPKRRTHTARKHGRTARYRLVFLTPQYACLDCAMKASAHDNVYAHSSRIAHKAVAAGIHLVVAWDGGRYIAELPLGTRNLCVC